MQIPSIPIWFLIVNKHLKPDFDLIISEENSHFCLHIKNLVDFFLQNIFLYPFLFGTFYCNFLREIEETIKNCQSQRNVIISKITSYPHISSFFENLQRTRELNTSSRTHSFHMYLYIKSGYTKLNRDTSAGIKFFDYVFIFIKYKIVFNITFRWYDNMSRFIYNF